MAERPRNADWFTEAEQSVMGVNDPELKRLAFQRLLDDRRASNSAQMLEATSKLIQVLAVVVGVIISVLSFNVTRQKEAVARELEAEAKKLELTKYYDQRATEAIERQTEAAKPFLELRQRMYLDAVKTAGILATPEVHTEAELKAAKRRFRELYVTDLTLVEGGGVENGMMGLASVVDPEITNLTEAQQAAYQLAHALRNSLVKSWGLDPTLIDNPH